MLHGSGKEEHELTPLDRCLEREGIVKFSLKEMQPGVFVSSTYLLCFKFKNSYINDIALFGGEKKKSKDKRWGSESGRKTQVS